jgi:hypothetical protein
MQRNYPRLLDGLVVGGKLVSFDPSDAMKVSGVEKVIEV